MITKEILLTNGYKQYSNGVTHPNADEFYQKRISDSEGIKYYINLFYYDLTKYNNTVQYLACVQFRDSLDNPLDVELIIDNVIDKTIEVEEFFEKMFIEIGCLYYEYYGDEY